MKFLDSIKALYNRSEEKIIVVDENLRILWKSDENLPDFLMTEEFSKLRNCGSRESVVIRYTDDYTIKAMPCFDEDKLQGYLLTFFDPEEIETLFDRSVHLKYKKNSVGNQKIALMPIVNALDNYKMMGKVLEPDFCEDAKVQVLKLLSATVNQQELTKYYQGDMFTELLNITQALEETAELFKSRFSDKCIFEHHIQHGIFLNMNYDCLQNAVLNLLVNGYMYNNKEKKRLSLRGFTRGNELFIEVWDNGDDADPEVLERAMVPFRGLEKYAQKEALGLAVSSKFSEYFGGRLTFEKGNGLTMKMILDYRIKEMPTSFRLRRRPMVTGEFQPASCLMAKALYK